MNVNGEEKYFDIIDRYRNLPIEELIDLQKQLKNSLSFRHQYISSEVLKIRLKRSLENIKNNIK